MGSDWKDRDETDPEPWRGDADAWRGSDPASDANGWRGTVHAESDAWKASLHEEEGGHTESPAAEDAERQWRGHVHFEDWPEWDAGPEYRMWKKLSDEPND